MYCITTEQLTHHFNKNEQVLDTINLKVPTGSIYGFLGPNGAGKTTTLRLILGLLKKQQGSIRIFDKPLEENRIEILKRTGSLIESPSLYAHLSARENLAILQKIYQCKKSRIDEALAIVGLANTGTKSAGKFSLGMKQRLSIAMAIMANPELLILDEPTNGLDPNGIIEIRELLKQLNQAQGMTILVSSHLLAEIEKMVTHIGIINKGKLIFQGTMDSLHAAQQQSAFITFDTNNWEAAKIIIEKNGFTANVSNGLLQVPMMDKNTVAAINQQLVAEQIGVYQISVFKNDLESIFIDLVK